MNRIAESMFDKMISRSVTKKQTSADVGRGSRRKGSGQEGGGSSSSGGRAGTSSSSGESAWMGKGRSSGGARRPQVIKTYGQGSRKNTKRKSGRKEKVSPNQDSMLKHCSMTIDISKSPTRRGQQKRRENLEGNCDNHQDSSAGSPNSPPQPKVSKKNLRKEITEKKRDPLGFESFGEGFLKKKKKEEPPRRRAVDKEFRNSFLESPRKKKKEKKAPRLIDDDNLKKGEKDVNQWISNLGKKAKRRNGPRQSKKNQEAETETETIMNDPQTAGRESEEEDDVFHGEEEGVISKEVGDSISPRQSNRRSSIREEETGDRKSPKRRSSARLSSSSEHSDGDSPSVVSPTPQQKKRFRSQRGGDATLATTSHAVPQIMSAMDFGNVGNQGNKSLSAMAKIRKCWEDYYERPRTPEQERPGRRNLRSSGGHSGSEEKEDGPRRSKELTPPAPKDGHSPKKKPRSNANDGTRKAERMFVQDSLDMDSMGTGDSLSPVHSLGSALSTPTKGVQTRKQTPPSSTSHNAKKSPAAKSLVLQFKKNPGALEMTCESSQQAVKKRNNPWRQRHNAVHNKPQELGLQIEDDTLPDLHNTNAEMKFDKMEERMEAAPKKDWTCDQNLEVEDSEGEEGRGEKEEELAWDNWDEEFPALEHLLSGSFRSVGNLPQEDRNVKEKTPPPPVAAEGKKDSKNMTETVPEIVSLISPPKASKTLANKPNKGGKKRKGENSPTREKKAGGGRSKENSDGGKGKKGRSPSKKKTFLSSLQDDPEHMWQNAAEDFLNVDPFAPGNEAEKTRINLSIVNGPAAQKSVDELTPEQVNFLLRLPNHADGLRRVQRGKTHSWRHKAYVISGRTKHTREKLLQNIPALFFPKGVVEFVNDILAEIYPAPAESVGDRFYYQTVLTCEALIVIYQIIKGFTSTSDTDDYLRRNWNVRESWAKDQQEFDI